MLVRLANECRDDILSSGDITGGGDPDVVIEASLDAEALRRVAIIAKELADSE